jgi:subfamily B ATP-binding cassette protein MsbA
MRNALRYLKFYFRLSGGRIVVFIILSLIAALCQGAAVAFFLPILHYGRENFEQNRVMKLVYSLIESLGISQENHVLLFLLSAASLAFCFSAALLVASRVYGARIETNLYAELQGRTVKRLFNSNYEYYSSKNLGYITNALNRQLMSVCSAFRYLGVIIINLCLGGTYILFPFMISLKMTLTAIVFGLFFLPLFRLVNHQSRKYSIINSETFSELDDQVIQVFSNYKYLKATGTYPTLAERIAVRTAKLCFSLRRIILWGTFPDPIQACAVTIMCGLCYFQITTLNTPPIDAFSLLGLLYMTYQKVITIPSSYQKFLSCAGAIKIYDQLDHELAEEQEHLSQGGAEPDFSGSLNFEKVSFRYRNSESDVLKDLSFEIEPNCSIAFVGGSGAGKSTIVNMLCGLLRPQDGRITLGGKDFKDIDIQKLRSKVSYVTQEPVIFNDTVLNNIKLWDKEKSKEDVEAAAVKAKADAFINEMPGKYDTVVGDRGVMLSGGQKQRLTIAREMLRDSAMLILDEATSALDSETEQLIQQSIDEVKGKKTVVVIAHRLSTVKKCDRIHVLENGSIVESGTYDELYRQNGKFREMVDRQDLGSEA